MLLDLSKTPQVTPVETAVAARLVLAVNDRVDDYERAFAESLTEQQRNTPFAQMLLLALIMDGETLRHISFMLDICCWSLGCSHTCNGCTDEVWDAAVRLSRQIVPGSYQTFLSI